MDSVVKSLFNYSRLFLLCLLFLIVSSCGLTFKTLMGLKNPKVENRNSIKEEINLLSFNCKPGKDVVYKAQSDSLSNYKILLSALDAELYFFNQVGKRLCYSENESCVADQFQLLEASFENSVGQCAENHEFDFVYEDFDSFLKNVESVDGEEVVKENLPAADYYFIYHWSRFAGGKKNKYEDYSWTINQLNLLNISYYMIRVNCDLREDAGFEKNRSVRLKLKMNKEKDGGRTAELTLGKLPYSKAN